MKTVADALVKTFRDAGIKTVFGIPSIHNIGLYESFRKNPDIKHILCRQEASATHMADGYARAAGHVGMVLTSTGPGAGYMVPALQEAFGSRAPVLALTTNVASDKIGKGTGTLHELEDQDHLFKSVTKDAILVRSEKDGATLALEAVKTALSGSPGPVYLEIPTDLLGKPFPEDQDISSEKAPVPEFSGDLGKASDLLKHSNRPLIIAGTEAVRAGLAPEIRSLAETLAAPVLTTTAAKGILPEDHICAFGNLVKRGIARDVLLDSDAVLCVGARLREADAKRRGVALPRLIHLLHEPRWLDKNFPAEIPLVGDIKPIIHDLLGRLEALPENHERWAWIKESHQALSEELGKIREDRVELQYLQAIREALPRDGIVVFDNTQLAYWGEYFYPSYRSGGVIMAKGAAPIGFSFPAAIGAKLACPDKKVVAVIGDGGFLYGAQELATCARHKIGFPVIVSNDNAYGIIGYLQRLFFEHEHENRLVNPDFAALSEAYGARAARVDNPGALNRALDEALASDEMWVINLNVSFEEPPFAKY